MKWYRPLAYIATLALGGAIGWAVEWYTSPMAKPMCLESGAEYVHRLIAALPAGYAPFWLAAGLPIYALALWGAISLHRLARR
jgi:hypothetical protein